MKRVIKVLLVLLLLSLFAVLLHRISSTTRYSLLAQTTGYVVLNQVFDQEPTAVSSYPDSMKKNHSDSNYQCHIWSSSVADSDNISLSLLQDMMRCSLSLGMSKERLDSYQTTMTSLAQKGTLLLTSFKEVLPDDKLLTTHRNPCWKTSFRTLIKKIHLKNSSQNLSSLLEESKCLEPDECIHCLPYFFIPGFPKCGTTSLHFILNHHPQLAPPSRKEVHMLSIAPLNNFTSDLLKARTIVYLGYFETAGVRPDAITYDSSPSLLFRSPFNDDYCLNAAIVSRLVPNAKFIVVMRNPVDRLYSGFFAFSKQYRKWPEPMQQNASLYFHMKVEEAVSQFKNCLSQGNSVYECSTVELRNWNELKSKKKSNSNSRPSLNWYLLYLYTEVDSILSY